MNGLKNWINENKKAIESVGTVVIALVAALVLIILFTKAIWAFKSGKMSESLKHIGYAAIVVLIAWMGIKGFKMLVEKIAPNSSILPRGH